MPEFLKAVRRFVTADQKDTAPVNSFEGFQSNGAMSHLEFTGICYWLFT